MRDLGEVLTKMMEVVPEDLGKSFKHIRDDKLPYCPPENEGMWWQYAHHYLLGYLPKNYIDPLNEWQKKVLTIWTEKEFK